MSEIKNFKLSMLTKQAAFDKINKTISNEPKQHWFLTLTRKLKKRSVSANNQQHLWYEQIANYYGDRLALDVKNECKDKLGFAYTAQ